MPPTVPNIISRRTRERGNVFFALFGAVALLGILGAAVTTFIKGPLNSSVKLTRVNVAESQMATMAQVLVMQSVSVANCDADNYVEPLPFVTATAPPNTALTGGGLLPANLSVVTTKDPWGTQYGYCAWDHGASTCPATIPATRLAGASTQVLGQTVIAVISAGPDKMFTTTCRSYADADVNSNGDLTDSGDLPMVGKADVADDDIIFAYSYEEASGASGGLWSLKSSDANVAVIDKELEVDGDALFTGAGTFSSVSSNTVSARTNDFVEFFNGIKVPEAATLDPTCDGAAEGIVRRNGSSALEMCVSNTWAPMAAPATTQIVTDTTTTCDGDTVGAVRYNSGTSQPQYCNGTTWLNFLTQTTQAAIVVTPDSSSTINVTGPCTGSCPAQTGPNTIFTVTNVGTATSGNITPNFLSGVYGQFDITYAQSTCSAPLAPGQSCVYAIRATAQGNYSYTGSFEIYSGGTLAALVPLAGTATGFGCTVGSIQAGGIAATCANATTPGYIINFPGCDVPGIGYKAIEAACDGDNSHDPVIQNDEDFWDPSTSNTTSGAQNSVNLKAHGNGLLPQASAYCDALVQNGYSDWFLPSLSEWQTYVYPSRTALAVSGNYWTSTWESNSYGGARYYYYHVDSNSSAAEHGFAAMKVRCMRRHNVALPAATTDTTPSLYFTSNFYSDQPMTSAGSIGDVYALVAGERQRSENFRVAGITTGISVTVSGSGTPAFTVNNGAPVTSATVYPNDIINIYANAPAAGGTSHTVTLTISGVAFTWRLYYANANTRQIFVTDSVWTGNLGGFAGGDTRCQSNATAAGLSGTWYAFLGSQASPIRTRIPWDWNRLVNMRGETVATSMGDLLDRTILSPIRYNASGGFVTNRFVWTGVYEGSGDLEQGNDMWGGCNSWASASSSYPGDSGRTDNVSVRWATGVGRNCNLTASLYCIGPF